MQVVFEAASRGSFLAFPEASSEAVLLCILEEEQMYSDKTKAHFHRVITLAQKAQGGVVSLDIIHIVKNRQSHQQQPTDDAKVLMAEAATNFCLLKVCQGSKSTSCQSTIIYPQIY
ncbi:hypothetical protein GOP47_0018435 [Adiantum capillus-veneris]|uniref:Uncharacterized protein n=1 Tax=Adiantum capillus-veneris TaxID=13818 RepID=A0A9D4UD72_ADICA|nr:hypothetical protein GOP47_0018435 [Adiantum capillus-veneris]